MMIDWKPEFSNLDDELHMLGCVEYEALILSRARACHRFFSSILLGVAAAAGSCFLCYHRYHHLKSLRRGRLHTVKAPPCLVSLTHEIILNNSRKRYLHPSVLEIQILWDYLTRQERSVTRAAQSL